MQLLKRAIVSAAIMAWAVFAFSPRDQIAAGAPEQTPETMVVVGDASVVNGSEALAAPTKVEIVGRYLVVVDRRAERPIHVLSSASGELVHSLGRTGDGPGEYRALRSIAPVPGSTSAFWAYDMVHSRLTYVDLENDGAMERPWEAELLTLETDSRVTGIEFTHDQRLIAAGFFSDGRLAVFDRGGEMLGSIGKLPAYDDEVPAQVLQHAYMGTLKAHPDGSLLAIGLRHASSIEIRNANGEFVATTNLEDDSFEPVFEVVDTERGPKMDSNEALRFGYIDISVTSDRIYGLYSGRTRAGYPGKATFGTQIHVFDWSGELVNVIEVEDDLIAIAVERDGSTLYGVRHDPAPAVMSWSLAAQATLASR